MAKVGAEGAKTEGVLVGFGGVSTGFSFYVDKGVPVFDYNFFEKHTVVKGKEPIPAGEATVEVDFDYQGEKDKAGGPAAITLKVNGKPVTHPYKAPFKFSGEIERVTVELKELPFRRINLDSSQNEVNP
jgi:arylsulfatase